MMVELNPLNKEKPDNQIIGVSPIGEKADEIEKILTAPMTRNRNLERVRENLPGLQAFIEREKEFGAKKIIELGAGEGALADDIQNTYDIGIVRIDGYKTGGKNSTPKGGRTTIRFDIRNFEKFPGPIWSVYSLHTLQYTHNAPDIIGHIYNKLKPYHCAYLQFTNGLRSNKIIEEFEKKNEAKGNIRITCTKKDVIIELLKNEHELIIPKYLSVNGFAMTGKDNVTIRNSKLFYRYLSEDNDPEQEWVVMQMQKEDTHNNLPNISLDNSR